MDIRQVHFEINDLINDENRLKNNNAGAVLYSVLNLKKMYFASMAVKILYFNTETQFMIFISIYTIYTSVLTLFCGTINK